MEGAKASTITPMNLVDAIPTKIELPNSDRAFLALISLVPNCLMKFIPIWLQNSTPNPRLVTKFTTNTAFISTGNPPTTSFSIHMHPINSKKTKKTQRPIIRAMGKLVKICKANTTAASPKRTFYDRTPLIYVY